MIKKTVLSGLLIPTMLSAKNYPLRKYEHVKEFYAPIAKDITVNCIKNNTPPGAILAMCGWETGYGSGYIYKITGNILSMQATSSDKMLPPLKLPKDKFGNYILDYDQTGGSGFSENITSWSQRPPSYKKDYRPDGIAGTSINLAHFEHHPDFRNIAAKQCVNDFLTKRMNGHSTIEVYNSTRKWLDNMVKRYGKQILLNPKVAMKFVEKIGGKPRSFCPHKSWVSNVKGLMKRGGFSDLSKKLLKGKKFDYVWK